ncbi:MULTISPECIES: glutaredoxin family protein [Peptoniphilus]|uniref:glutaredoxin family protein n=1 Tax=Peptoniphilus TaxID=162289 RepID=UPI000781FA3E|nr:MULTISPECIES: glutathione S-transferase N-terminal domain-containing protein [Peptoniphilus]KXB71595.1 glutaredoxin [Peptoniphilus sp. DNF00840]
MEKLTLYVGTVCPFCKKVEAFMEDAGIDSVEIKNIDQDKEAREYLIEKGGKKQVPCLFIGDKPLYESLDIIKYLKENLD